VYNYDHKFPLKIGTMVYVQDAAQKAAAEDLCDWIDGRWRAPRHFYHFRRGGHVAAARLHQSAPFILGLDLRRFFDQVTRTKVHRALRRLGYSSADAYEVACKSTVTKDNRPGAYSLPFGFVQSMHLASVALHYSELGREMLRVRRSGVRLSNYVDDVLLSGDTVEALMEARNRLFKSADVAGFGFNGAKERGPADQIEAFNVWIGRGELRVADRRLNDFRQTALEPPDAPALATIAYVRTVNEAQANELADIRKKAGL
jgi:Reverse transcriptase (RNA-dependent DNA polymerase)